MSNAPELSITPEQTAGLSEAGKAALTEQLSKHYAPEQIARAMGTQAPGSVGEKTATEQLVQPFTNGKPPTNDPALRPPMTAAGNEPYEKRVAAFKNLAASGHVAVETLQKAAKAEGIAWAEISKEAPAEPDKTVTLQEANERLAQSSGSLAASLSPSDFAFQFERGHIEGLDPAEVSEIHSMFANALHAATIPLSLGQSVVSEAMTAANLYEGMDETTATLKYAQEGAKLRRLGNADQIAADHNYAWARLPAGFKEAASKDRLFHTASSFAALANAGAMMRAR